MRKTFDRVVRNSLRSKTGTAAVETHNGVVRAAVTLKGGSTIIDFDLHCDSNNYDLSPAAQQQLRGEYQNYLLGYPPVGAYHFNKASILFCVRKADATEWFGKVVGVLRDPSNLIKLDFPRFSGWVSGSAEDRPAQVLDTVSRGVIRSHSYPLWGSVRWDQ